MTFSPKKLFVKVANSGTHQKNLALEVNQDSH